MDKVSNALNAIKDASVSGASTVGGVFSSTAESGVSMFKATSLGESFFKNISAILVVVFILLGGILYIEFASSSGSAGVTGAAPGTKGAAAGPKKEFVDKTVYIEPNTGLDAGAAAGTRALPTDVPWTVPALSIRNELTEAFGSKYTEAELENIHTKCSDKFCVMNQKSPEDLEKACNSVTSRTMCGTKCCCGWTKYTGFEGDNDPTVVMNTAEANVADPSGQSSKVPGKCVAGNSKTPFDRVDNQNQARDIDYYYYLGQCVGGRGCMNKGAIRSGN
jgi:hypothetical protein